MPNQRVHPLEVVLPLNLMLIHIQVIRVISAVISCHPSSFCVFETLSISLWREFFFWRESRSPNIRIQGGQSWRNREKGTGNMGNTCSPLWSRNMCPDSEHFGENPSLPKKAGLFLFGAAHPLVTGLWFLVCYATTQRATQLRQRCIQVVCSNKEARKRLTESNGTPAMDPGHMNIDLTYTFAYYCHN